MIVEQEVTVKKVYNNWLSQVSENSRASYGRVVPQFFHMTFREEIKNITDDMLESITPVDVSERYINKLRVEGYKDSTISNYISVVRSFITELEANRMFSDIDYIYLLDTALSTKRLKDDSKHRTKMSADDYETFSQWLTDREWSKRYEEKGVQYALALKFMYVTAVRVNSTFSNIKWSNIKPNFDSHGNFGYIVYALDKGSKVNKKPITEEFYEELRVSLFEGDEDSLVFKNISKQTFTRLMKEFSEDTGREITPHSIKVGAGTKLYSMTKDLLKVQKFLDHDDPKTTLRYIRASQDITESGSYILSSKISIDELDNISYDNLVSIIKEKPELAYAIIGSAKKHGLIDIGENK